jgi:hypothetical protein
MNEAKAEAARHELTTLHGLYAFDGAAPSETWRISTAAAMEVLDGALDPRRGASPGEGR